MSVQPISGDDLEPEAADVALPELAVAPSVLVVSLTNSAEEPDGEDRVGRLTEEWIALDPSLRRHAGELADLLEVVTGEVRLGEVAAFLDYRQHAVEGLAGAEARAAVEARSGDDRRAVEDRRLVGGAAVLSLELVDEIAGATGSRARAMAQHLRRAADGPSSRAGFCQVTTRRTASGVPATRVRFVAAGVGDGGGPVVEVCRWLYPVPGRADLVWALAFQTTDLDQAEDLVAQFDLMAASLTWVDPDG